MLSSARLNSPQLQPALSLAALALAALALSLLLAFAFAMAPRRAANGDSATRTTVESRFGSPARQTTAQIPIVAPAAQPPAASSFADRPTLWALLAPFTFAVDAIAVLGLAAVLVVRYNVRRRRGVRI